MKRKLNIKYMKDRCIGNASCAALAPNQFVFKGQKADLIGGKDEGNSKFSLIVNCKDNEANEITKFDSNQRHLLLFAWKRCRMRMSQAENGFVCPSFAGHQI